MIFPKVIVASVIFTLFSQAASADANSENALPPDSRQRLCTLEDLKGAYLMVYFKETPPAGESEAYAQFPYQYLEFYPKNTFSFISMGKPVITPTLLEAYFEPGRKLNLRYILRAGGVLDMYANDTMIYHYRCVASIADKDILKKGDLVLDGYSKNGRNEFYKLYRRWY